jgi:hypothetical protein
MLSRFLIKLIQKLPGNGDWIFVTPSPIVENNYVDIADKYSKPDDIITQLHFNNIEIAKLTLEQAKSYESKIRLTADHVRDKAKTLFSAASFTSAIFLIILSFFSTYIGLFGLGIVIIEFLLILLMAGHLIRALLLAIDVMTREESVVQSPLEFLSPRLTRNDDSLENYKYLVSQTVAYSNMTHKYILQRINKLIIAQYAFKYGLIYFTIIFLFFLVSSSITKSEDPSIELLKSIEKFQKEELAAEKENQKLFQSIGEDILNIKLDIEKNSNRLFEIEEKINNLKQENYIKESSE